MKLKLPKVTTLALCVAAIRSAAEQSAAAWQLYGHAIKGAVKLGIGADAEATTTKTAGAARKDAVIEWAKDSIASDTAFETGRAYIGQWAAVACAPQAEGRIKAKKGAVTVVKSDKIKTNRDLAAVAKAANAALGIKPRGTSGSRTAGAATESEQTIATLKEELAKAKAAPTTNLRPALSTVCAEVQRILTDGTPTERVALADAIRKTGRKLAELEAKATKPTTRKAPPVKPEARKPGKKRDYADGPRVGA